MRLNKSSPSRASEFGGMLFYILVGVVLFGMLLYVYSRSGSSSTSIANKAKISAASSDQNEYSRMVLTGIDKLRFRGCSDDQISYESPSGQDANPKAPSDKSCNIFDIKGANVPYRSGFAGVGCDLTVLTIGQSCGGIVYAGLFSGTRIYTTPADMTKTTWNNTSTNWYTTGVTSGSDGKGNTDTLVSLADIGAPYKAATTCRSLGSRWYLPSINELNTLYTNRLAIGGFESTANYSYPVSTGYYISSTESGNASAMGQLFTDGTASSLLKDWSFSIRCIRR